MKKIIRKEGKIYEVWSNDASFRHTTWTVIGTYDEENATGDVIEPQETPQESISVDDVDNVSTPMKKTRQRRNKKAD